MSKVYVKVYIPPWKRTKEDKALLDGFLTWNPLRQVWDGIMQERQAERLTQKLSGPAQIEVKRLPGGE